MDINHHENPQRNEWKVRPNWSRRLTVDEGQAVAFGMTSAATYLIVLSGQVDKDWVDCFNGVQIQQKRQPSGRILTTLKCCVRDQSELLGVLNRLNSLNFPIISVSYLKKEA